MGLLLFLTPYFFVKYAHFYPNGYDYQQKSLHLEIYKLDEKGEVEETFIKDNPTPTVVEKESGEKNYVPLRGYISDIKGWYENVSLALGLVLVAIVLAVIPNNFLKQVLRLSPDLHEEVRNDFPRFYKFIRKTGEPTFYKVILIGVSSFALYWVWNQYPLEYVVQVDLFLNTLKK